MNPFYLFKYRKYIGPLITLFIQAGDDMLAALGKSITEQSTSSASGTDKAIAVKKAIQNQFHEEVKLIKQRGLDTVLQAVLVALT